MLSISALVLFGRFVIKGVLYPEIYFFIQFKFQICAFTHLKAKIKKILENFSVGCATPPNVSKLGVYGVKGTAKTSKD